MVEAVTVYKSDDGTSFTSFAEAKAHEAKMIVRPLVESGPFTSLELGMKWLSENAAEIVKILSSSKPAKAATGKKRGRRTKAEIQAALAAQAADTEEDTALAA